VVLLHQWLPGEYDLREVIYRCPTCGDLLEVQHDMEALKSRSAAAWIQLFDDRYRRNAYPYGSGVWGKKEWVVPFLDNENIVSMYEGSSNLLWATATARASRIEDLWVKQCGNSHTGSFKDLGMTVLVSVVKQMIAGGVPIDAVACASTGDTSAALGAYCAFAGIPSVVLLPKDKVSIAQLVQPLANGSLVLSLDTDFDGCMTIGAGDHQGEAHLPRQLDEQPPHRGAEDGGHRDRAAVRLGSAGLDHHPRRQPRKRARAGPGVRDDAGAGAGEQLPRICLAQAERANPLYRSFQNDFKTFEPITAQSTLAMAIQIGNPVSVKRAIRTLQRSTGWSSRPRAGAGG
jgi:threonine synthase